MAPLVCDELQVVVPVGFLLAEAREVTVSVDRPDGGPLPVRLRLIPARPSAAPPAPVSVSDPTPLVIAWPTRAAFEEDGYGEPEYGGGD
jgi:hypothetical protein